MANPYYTFGEILEPEPSVPLRRAKFNPTGDGFFDPRARRDGSLLVPVKDLSENHARLYQASCPHLRATAQQFMEAMVSADVNMFVWHEPRVTAPFTWSGELEPARTSKMPGTCPVGAKAKLTPG